MIFTAPSGGSVAIGGAITGGTSGSVVYIDVSGNLAQDNTYLNFDATNKRLTVKQLSFYNSASAHYGQIDAANYNGLWLASTDNQVIIGNNGFSPSYQIAIFNTANSGSEPALSLFPKAVGKPAVRIKLESSQTAKALEVLDSSNNLLSGITKDGHVIMAESTAPSAPSSDQVLIYAQDNGAGKTQLMALFSSGAAQQLAIQP